MLVRYVNRSISAYSFTLRSCGAARAVAAADPVAGQQAASARTTAASKLSAQVGDIPQPSTLNPKPYRFRVSGGPLASVGPLSA